VVVRGLLSYWKLMHKTTCEASGPDHLIDNHANKHLKGHYMTTAYKILSWNSFSLNTHAFDGSMSLPCRCLFSSQDLVKII